MSDDDRMDRAERIRRMREGNRETDDATANGSANGATEPTAADDGASGETDGAVTDDAVTDDAVTTASETETTATTGSPPTENAGSTASSGADPTPTEDTTEAADQGGSTTEADQNAMAVAQRVAQTAAEVTDTENAHGGQQPAGMGEQGEISAALNPMQGPAGVELPDQELINEAMENSQVGQAEGATQAAALNEETTQSEELVRVLEFALGDEYYCLDIEFVEEIVKRETVTRVPNTPEYVEGVVDLRGQITTILDPKAMMDIDTDGNQNLMVVFDPEKFEEQGAVGWIVDEVRQVGPVAEDEVNRPPVDADYINGVVDRDSHDQFVIWVEPDDALQHAIGEEES